MLAGTELLCSAGTDATRPAGRARAFGGEGARHQSYEPGCALSGSPTPLSPCVVAAKNPRQSGMESTAAIAERQTDGDTIPQLTNPAPEINKRHSKFLHTRVVINIHQRVPNPYTARRRTPGISERQTCIVHLFRPPRQDKPVQRSGSRRQADCRPTKPDPDYNLVPPASFVTRLPSGPGFSLQNLGRTVSCNLLRAVPQPAQTGNLNFSPFMTLV